LDAINITGTGLDSFKAHPTDFHLTVLAQKSAGGDAHNTKTDVVVTVVAVVVVAIRRTAVVRIVVPRTTALNCLSHFYSYQLSVISQQFVSKVNLS
jgi:hypothetical protein